MRRGSVEVIGSKGCTRLFAGPPHSSSSQEFADPPMSPAASSMERVVHIDGPFSGLVICVTGLSKEARKQVKDATERLGGQYSPNLHPQCTHLVVQCSGGRKLEHAMKYGSKNGLSVVTIGWFVDSVRRNARLSESLYRVTFVEENAQVNGLNRLVEPQNTCLPAGLRENAELSCMAVEQRRWFSRAEDKQNPTPTLCNHSLYVDDNVSPNMRAKVLEAASGEGATILNKWFVGCLASYVVCEGPSSHRYLGHSNNIVTPLWVLKTAKESKLQRLVHISADLGRQIGTILENEKNVTPVENSNHKVDLSCQCSKRDLSSQQERRQAVDLAKAGVRSRRGRRMQTCQIPLRPVTPSTLLDSICWLVSEPPSHASIYTDSLSNEDATEHQADLFLDAKSKSKDPEASFVNFSRPLKESEKSEMVFKNPFLTILFPVDRFSEMGPSSRTFFSDTGFSCAQILDHLYSFYQEPMSADEVDAAIHTDSRHADRLRTVYCSEEAAERGCVMFKRVDFLGSRKSFEMLKRVSGDNSGNVYELLIRA
uniref:BRCT domain-containing protein n=2 Tax=Kalanchoe fedtschenkoi TaxID=63787 RepID=A0A7N1A4K9_KALFE